MLEIDIKIKHNNMEFPFKASVKRGEIFTFAVGEEIMRDKLFWALCGINKDYTGEIKGEGICFNSSTFNNVLAIGDRSMFIRGSVTRNIYKALRVRADKQTAKSRTDEVIKLYGLERLSKLNVKLLDDNELLTVALARAHFRKIGLVVFKKLEEHGEIDLSKFSDAYIIKVS